MNSLTVKGAVSVGANSIISEHFFNLFGGSLAKKAFGTYHIATICHVMPATVGRWIEEGKLPSFRTGGGHRRVWAADLVRFLKSHNIPVPPALAGVGSFTVLVVDDEKSVRRLVQKMLEANFEDIQIYEAEDGFEAGRKVTQLAPNLVLLDLRLPGVDGVKVCRNIRADKELKKVKILAMSGFNVAQAKNEVMASGADDFIGKPFDEQTLLEAVERLTGSSVGQLRRSAPKS